MIRRYNIYAGETRESINYASPVAQADHPVLQAVATQPAGTQRWYVVRAENDAGEEQNDSVAVYCRIDADGHLVGPVPTAPQALAAEALAGGKIRLSWVYHTARQETPPDEFGIYGDGGTGTIDYDTPLASVAYADRRPWHHWESGPLVHGTEYRFAVRSASAAGDEELNLNFVEIVADNLGPDLHQTWLTEVQS